VMLPVPSVIQTRATAVLRRPVALCVVVADMREENGKNGWE
jgi:hypothetical protein